MWDIEGVGCDAFSKLEDLQESVRRKALRNFVDSALYNIGFIALKMKNEYGSSSLQYYLLI